MIDLSKIRDQIILLSWGTFYGCLRDKNNNIIKKGFETREEARAWIADKTEYDGRWTE